MRKLTLKKETLVALTPDELGSIVGAVALFTLGEKCDTLSPNRWSEVDACLTAQGCGI